MAKKKERLVPRLMDSMLSLLRSLCRFVVLTAIMAGTMLILIDIGQFFFQSSDFSVKEISVEGTERLTPEEIQTRAEIAPGTNIWLLDLKEMEERIALHPTIAKAFVQRVPPHRLHIKVEERSPAAYMWNVVDEQFYGIDESGVFFTKVPIGDETVMQKHRQDWDDFLSYPVISTDDDVPIVLGEAVEDQRVLAVLPFLKRLKKRSNSFFSELAECEINLDETIVLHPKRRIGAIIIRNMESPELAKKIAAFWDVVETHDLRAIYVDARFPRHGFAVRWDETNGNDWKQLYHKEIELISAL